MEKFTKSEKKAVVWVLVVIALIAAVCLLPWPSRIHATMYGTVVNEAGETVKETTFTLVGWKFNYLFREDTITLDMKFPLGHEHLFGVTYFFGDNISESYDGYDTMFCTLTDHKRIKDDVWCNGYISLSRSMDRCFIITDYADGWIYASADENYDLEELIQTYEELTALPPA